MADRIILADPLLVCLILVVCGVIIILQRVEIAIGVFFAATNWAYNIDVLSVVLVWILVGTVLLSSVSTIMKRRVAIFSVLLDRTNLKFVMLMLVWAAWTIITCVLVFPSDLTETFGKYYVVYGLFSFFCVMLFIVDMKQVRGFAISFVVTSISAGLLGLMTLQQESSGPLAPRPDRFQLTGIGTLNYLEFAIPLAISILFLLFWVFKKGTKLKKGIIVGSIGVLSVLLAMTVARQSLLGILVAVPFVLYWYLRKTVKSRRNRMWLAVSLAALGLLIWGVTASDFIVDRWSADALESGLTGRRHYGLDAFYMFLRSPIWGHGWQYVKVEGGWAHNIFLDAMASQGVIGLAFLLGFIAMVLFASRGTWAGVGVPHLDNWRAILLGCFIYTLIQQMFSGGLTSPHFYWIGAILWRFGAMARALSEEDREKVKRGPELVDGEWPGRAARLQRMTGKLH